MRAPGLAIVVFLVAFASRAFAQPVDYKIEGTNLVIVAKQAVDGLRLELDRTPATKHLTLSHGALAKDARATFALATGTYRGKLTVDVPGAGPWTGEMAFGVANAEASASPLKITYDADHLDLDARRLELKASLPPTSIELTVIGEDGSTLATAVSKIAKPPTADTWIPITWTTTSTTRVMMLKVRVAAAGGIATNVELIPWSVAVAHEDVTFATDSAVITASEAAKLDASIAKIADAQKAAEKFLKLRLYIAGHTDTVGPSTKNLKLSLDRARAIATYFRKHGITLPIAFAGFGEEVLAKRTADNVDEATNRRADYVLGPAAGAPPFKGPYTKVKTSWAQLR